MRMTVRDTVCVRLTSDTRVSVHSSVCVALVTFVTCCTWRLGNTWFFLILPVMVRTWLIEPAVVLESVS